jgi:hypothetical protein
MNRRLLGKEKSLNDRIKDEDGTEWWQDDDGYWWFRPEGDDDWLPYDE